MVYTPVKGFWLRLLQTPSTPPEAPAGEHVEVFRASPKYLAYRMIGVVLHAVLVVAIECSVLIGSLVSGEPLAAAAAIGVAVLLCAYVAVQYFATRIDYDLRHYIVTDRAVRVRQGAWLVREMTITHANVQNLRVTQGPLQRLFGFSNLEIDTAGGGGSQQAKGGAMLSGHTVQIAGVENAHEIRDKVLAHLRARGAGTGLGDTDDHDDHATSAASAPDLVATLAEVRDAARALRAAAEARA